MLGPRKKSAVPHPGTILAREFLEPLALSQAELARALAVPGARVGALIRGKCALSPEMALRLARYFGVSARAWLELQARYDLAKAERAAGARIRREVRKAPLL